MDRAQLEELLGGLVRAGGTTLHLMPDHAPFVRIEDGMLPSDIGPVSGQVVSDLIRDFLFEDHRQQLRRGEEVEVMYTTGAGVRFRATVAPQCRGISVVFRRLPDRVPSFEDLGLPELLSSFLGFRRGLVIVTGFYGSGTSTTLAAMVDRLNRESAVHIAAIECPIEFIFQPDKALIHQREVPSHVNSVATGVRDACRQGAEVIVVSDLADGEALRAVLDAAERGCLVLAGMRASGVVGGLTELVHSVEVDERAMMRARLSAALRAMVGQTLIHRRHANGRVPMLEILIRTQTVADVIRDGQLAELPDLMRRGRGLGMQTTDQALRSLLTRNVITLEEAVYHAVDRDWVASKHPSA